MLNFRFISPTEIYFGKDTERFCGEAVKKHGGSRVLIIHGTGSAVRSGLLDRVCQSLAENGLHFQIEGGVVANPRDEKAAELVRVAVDKKLDFVLGVGGGSVLDTAKAVAVGALSPATPLWDFFSYKVPVEKALPVGSVMTFPATGSEASPSSVLNFAGPGLKRGLGSDLIRPVFAVLNPELTYTLSPYQTACGIVDMMSHLLERYFSNTPHVDVTDRLCEGLLKSIMDAARGWLKNPNDYESRAALMWASTLAHNNVAGVGREQDWACHALEHELSYRYDVAHGAGLAVITIAWMRYVAPLAPAKLCRFAVEVLGLPAKFEDPVNLALAGTRRLAAFFHEIGMPLTFEELGGDPADIPALTQTVKRLSHGKAGNYVPLDDAAIKAVYRLSLAENAVF